jgi:hypothetical protein
MRERCSVCKSNLRRSKQRESKLCAKCEHLKRIAGLQGRYDDGSDVNNVIPYLGALLAQRRDLSDPHAITLGIAAASVLADDLKAGQTFDTRKPETARRIWREYARIVRDPTAVLQEINRKAYERAEYAQRCESFKAAGEEQLAQAMSVYLLDQQRDKLEADLAAESSHVPDFAEDVYDSINAEAVLSEWRDVLGTPALKAGLEAILNDEPVADEADKKRRQRARDILKKHVERQKG